MLIRYCISMWGTKTSWSDLGTKGEEWDLFRERNPWKVDFETEMGKGCSQAKCGGRRAFQGEERLCMKKVRPGWDWYVGTGRWVRGVQRNWGRRTQGLGAGGRIFVELLSEACCLSLHATHGTPSRLRHVPCPLLTMMWPDRVYHLL